MLQILNLLSTKEAEINEWINRKWKGLVPSPYLSCDVRHSGAKMGVIDANLFPGGFNNLCNSYSRMTSDAFKEYFSEYYPDVKKILIFGEEHTRNKFYLLNLARIQAQLVSAGFEVRVGVMGDFMEAPTLSIDLEESKLTLEKITVQDSLITLAGFSPDLILSNHDFSGGVPFEDVKQPVIPDPSSGWWKRRKSDHFDILDLLFADFGELFQVDPWLLTTIWDVSDQIDFDNEEQLIKTAKQIDLVLDKIRSKYSQHSITETPFVYLKSNHGTYGLGVMPLFSGEELLQLNRKKRTKLLSSKSKMPVTDYLIQEGITTLDQYSDHPIEPVIYCVGKKDVGGFFRIHESKNTWESLNSPGMMFSCLCLHKLDEPHERQFIDCAKKEAVVAMSRLLTRISALAAAMELQKNQT